MCVGYVEFCVTSECLRPRRKRALVELCRVNLTIDERGVYSDPAWYAGLKLKHGSSRDHAYIALYAISLARFWQLYAHIPIAVIGELVAINGGAEFDTVLPVINGPSAIIFYEFCIVYKAHTLRVVGAQRYYQPCPAIGGGNYCLAADRGSFLQNHFDTRLQRQRAVNGLGNNSYTAIHIQILFYGCCQGGDQLTFIVSDYPCVQRPAVPEGSDKAAWVYNR